MFTQSIDNELGTGTLVGCELKCRNTRMKTHIIYTHIAAFFASSLSLLPSVSSLLGREHYDYDAGENAGSMCGFDINGRVDAGDGAEGAICEVDAEGRRAVVEGGDVWSGCRGSMCELGARGRRTERMRSGGVWSGSEGPHVE